MATKRSLLNAIGFILLFAIDYAASGQYSGVLSNIYKKAAQENRPLILVLDNTKTSHDNGKARGPDYSYKTLDLSPKEDDDQRSKSDSALDNHRDNDVDQQPFLASLLQTLNQQNSVSKHQYGKSQKHHDHSLTRSRPRDRRNRRDRRDRLRLRSRPNNRERRDQHDRRDRLRLRSQLDRDDRDRKEDINYRDRRDDKDGSDRRDDRDRKGDRRDRAKYYRDDENSSIKAFIGKYQAARYPNEIERDEENDRALRSSVVKNLLRISNDLNCDAQDECKNHCDDNYDKENKADECADACADKFKCEAEKDHRNDVEECDFADSCAESREAENNPSTRGIKFEGDGDAKTDDDCK